MGPCISLLCCTSLSGKPPPYTPPPSVPTAPRSSCIWQAWSPALKNPRPAVAKQYHASLSECPTFSDSTAGGPSRSTIVSVGSGGESGLAGLAGLPGDGVDHELVVSHVSRVGQDRQRRELDETEAAVITRSRRALERGESRLRLEAFDEVLALSWIIGLINDPQSHRTCRTHRLVYSNSYRLSTLNDIDARSSCKRGKSLPPPFPRYPFPCLSIFLLPSPPISSYPVQSALSLL